MTSAAQLSDSDVTGDIASAVAAALTAIDEDSWTVSTQQRGVLLTSADGAVLRLRIGRHGTETGRLIVACESPSDARDVPGAEALRARATADPARPAARIAADLHRRLVEPYRAARPAAREWRRAADARTAAEESILAEVRSNLAGLRGLVRRDADGVGAGVLLHSAHPHAGPLEQVHVAEPSLKHEIRAAHDNREVGGIGASPLYTEVRMRVHPRLLPDLSRALAVLGWAADISSVPAHQCPHSHEPLCRHGHDHLAIAER